jgi:polysaccharide biosynthesis protein PelC
MNYFLSKTCRWASYLIGFLLLSACTTIKTSNNITLNSTTKIAVLPFINNTETVQANIRAASMTSHLMQTNGARIINYPDSSNCQTLLSCKNPNFVKKQAVKWALKNNANLILTGNVNEWRYNVGLDGEPSVSLTLRLVDVKNKRLLWSAVGSKIGGSRAGLGGVAQNLLMEMLANLKITRNTTKGA